MGGNKARGATVVGLGRTLGTRRTLSVILLDLSQRFGLTFEKDH